jgi:hypothetical protein
VGMEEGGQVVFFGILFDQLGSGTPCLGYKGDILLFLSEVKVNSTSQSTSPPPFNSRLAASAPILVHGE